MVSRNMFQWEILLCSKLMELRHFRFCHKNKSKWMKMWKILEYCFQNRFFFLYVATLKGLVTTLPNSVTTGTWTENPRHLSPPPHRLSLHSLGTFKNIIHTQGIIWTCFYNQLLLSTFPKWCVPLSSDKKELKRETVAFLAVCSVHW